MKRWGWIGFIAFAIGLFLFACGGDDSDGTTSSSSSSGLASSSSSSGAAQSDGGTTSSSSSSSSSSGSTDDGGTTNIPATELEDTLLVNELYFGLPKFLGKKIWVHGFYGDKVNESDGMGVLADNARRLITDEAYPHHSVARLSGALPSADHEQAEVIVYGEVKDYAVVTGKPQQLPTPLVVVEKFVKLNSAVHGPSFAPLLRPENAPAVPNAGTTASTCDRAVIISGGIDETNNHSRYVDNVKATYSKLKSLGFTADQIEVFYNNGGAIDVDGTNVTDQSAGKKKIADHLAALAASMPASCTLTVFVTDHGTGYNGEDYHGARPAFTGVDATTGKTYNENAFKFDARSKVMRFTEGFTYRGKTYSESKSLTGQTTLWRRDGTSWVPLGSDTNGNGNISEKEADTDFDGDGVKSPTLGFNVNDIDGRLKAAQEHYDNEWDSDADGVFDTRLHWDGTRYVAQRFTGGSYKEMGRDTNGDFVIDATDGGIDWNLDGDKGDKIGFHEGINLWGNEVLWDDEFATMMKVLSDKGVHIMVHMLSCYSGGFVEELKGIVENVVASSNEDQTHDNRYGTDGVVRAADGRAFLENLTGIDSASWSAAADAAHEADVLAANAVGDTPNGSVRYETPKFTSTTKFQANGSDYDLEIHIPAELSGKVYDFEIIFGLQQPRWNGAPFGGFDVPAGYTTEAIPGGARVFRAAGIEEGLLLKAKGGAAGATQLRIELTDVNHVRLGYTMAQPGTVVLPKKSHATAFTIGFQHFSGFSHVKGDVTVGDAMGTPIANATVTLNLDGGSPQTFVTNASGVASYFFVINTFATYTVNLTNITATGFTYSPADNVASSRTVVVN